MGQPVSRQPARLRVEVSSSEMDVVSGELWSLGTTGIEEQRNGDEVVLLAGFDSATDADTAAKALGRFTVLEELGAGAPYLDRWREHAAVQRAGNRIVIRPPWVPHDVEPVELVLHIEPGRSFGSGSHPSTRLALADLERILEGDEKVLDVGCGSGILSVAAARLGATDVVGIDTDRHAPALTLANASRNAVGDFVQASNSPIVDVEGQFDVVVANMLAPTLRELSPHLVARTRPGGRLVVAGLLEHQVADIVDALRPLPHLTTSRLADATGTWVSLTFGSG